MEDDLLPLAPHERDLRRLEEKVPIATAHVRPIGVERERPQRRIPLDVGGVEAGVEEIRAVRNDRGLPPTGLIVIDIVAAERKEVHPIPVTAHVLEPCLEHHVELDVHLVVARHEPAGD